MASCNDRLPVTNDQAKVMVVPSTSIDDMPSPGRAGCNIANPAPLGLAAFGVTTMMLMWVETGWAGSGPWVTAVMGYAMFYGGFGQFVAGVFEMIKGNTFAATAFCSYGCFWMGWCLKNWFVRGPLLAAAYTSKDLTGEALYLALWGLFTMAMFVPTMRKNGCLMFIFGTLTVTFFLLVGGVYMPACSQAAGYVGLLCGFSAFYTAMAEVWADSLGVTPWGLRPVRFI